MTNPSSFTSARCDRRQLLRAAACGFGSLALQVHLHDLHATMLHLLGLDHERLTYRHSGRDYRLTDVEGRVVKQIVA